MPQSTESETLRRDKWLLSENPIDYLHSSAKFYATGQQGAYEVTSYSALKDVDLTVLKNAAESRVGDSAER